MAYKRLLHFPVFILNGKRIRLLLKFNYKGIEAKVQFFNVKVQNIVSKGCHCR
jgi:hypothetical protein